jgi:ABC-2 type transport system permease protein
MMAMGISARTVRAEWLKLTTVRSTYVVLLVAVGLGLGVGWLDLAGTASDWATLAPADRAAFDPVADSFAGFQYSELAFGALGVLAISTEYATGGIRVSLTAVPQRGRLYAAKAVALAVPSLFVCLTCALVAFVVGQAILRPRHLDTAVTDTASLRAVVAAGSYMTVLTMVGFGLGAIIRHTAGALAALFGLVFLAWPLARAFESISYLPDRWLLVNAGDALVRTQGAVGPHAARTPSPGLAVVVLVTYAVVFLGAGAVRALRDA